MLLTLALFAVVIVVVFSLGDRAANEESAGETDVAGASSHVALLSESTDATRTADLAWPSINVDGTPMIIGTMVDVQGRTYGDTSGRCDDFTANDPFSHDAFSSPSSMSGSDW